MGISPSRKKLTLSLIKEGQEIDTSNACDSNEDFATFYEREFAVVKFIKRV